MKELVNRDNTFPAPCTGQLMKRSWFCHYLANEWGATFVLLWSLVKVLAEILILGCSRGELRAKWFFMGSWVRPGCQSDQAWSDAADFQPICLGRIGAGGRAIPGWQILRVLGCWAQRSGRETVLWAAWGNPHHCIPAGHTLPVHLFHLALLDVNAFK